MSPFDNLPAELYDEVFQYLAYSSWEPTNHISRRPARDEIHPFDHVTNIHRRPVERGICWWPRPGDIQLRLVSRAFNRAMLRVYFKYEGAVFSASEINALERLEEFIINQEETMPWRVADVIEKFTIELCPPGFEDEAAIFHASHKDMISWPQEDGRVIRLDDCAARLEDVLEKRTLARAICKMPRLDSLIINLNQQWRDEEEGDGYDSEDGIGHVLPGLELRLKLLQDVREGVAAIFKPLDAINIEVETNHLAFLTYLRIALPCVYDFAHLASCMPDTVALRLRHLYLEVVDGTGPGGDRSYLRSRDGSQDPTDGDEGYRFSNLQRKFPNTAYMRGMCDLVNRCKNLESLGLVGTQCINLEGLDWQPTNSLGGLKNIYMSRVVATAEQLMTLMQSGSQNSACNIEAFEIEDVELMDGTWESIFARLLTSSSLTYINIYNLVYNRHGNSAHLATYNHRPWENVSVIWSESRQDRKRLRDVIRGMEGRGIEVEKQMIQYVQDALDSITES